MSDRRAAAGPGALKRVVVVGSGAAGLVTALEVLRLSPTAEVVLVTKGELPDGSTRYAQGGIAAAVMPGDSVESHVSDTIAAGAGLSDAEAVRVLCAEGPVAIGELVRWGVGFDRAAAGFDAGLEGAHSHHRILHAGGDATGAAISRALVRTVRESRVEVLEHAFLLDLVLDDGVVSGVRVLDVDPGSGSGSGWGAGAGSGGAGAWRGGGWPGGGESRHPRIRVIDADAVVLATGGIGQLYPHTTNPAVATGDGAAAALRAGAVLRDVEFVQFHPTALAVPGSFLVSEAVRGDGAVLVNGAGVRFMPDAHPLAELAPRDVVARAIAAQMASGSPVFLDATSLGRDELARRFPTIDAASRAAGFDWAVEPLPVAPAAHYWMGGVATDLSARTSVPGLYAVGEVASTGVHGANRLASNSLLEAVVFARRAAAALAHDPVPARWAECAGGSGSAGWPGSDGWPESAGWAESGGWPGSGARGGYAAPEVAASAMSASPAGFGPGSAYPREGYDARGGYEPFEGATSAMFASRAGFGPGATHPWPEPDARGGYAPGEDAQFASPASSHPGLTHPRPGSDARGGYGPGEAATSAHSGGRGRRGDERDELHRLMWEAAGLHRSAEPLAAAFAALVGPWPLDAAEHLAPGGAAGHLAPGARPTPGAHLPPGVLGAHLLPGARGEHLSPGMLGAPGMPDGPSAPGGPGGHLPPSAPGAATGLSVRDLETANLRLLGAAVVHSALAREESRGAHFRRDFPLPRPELAHHIPITLDVLSHAAGAPKETTAC